MFEFMVIMLLIAIYIMADGPRWSTTSHLKYWKEPHPPLSKLTYVGFASGYVAALLLMGLICALALDEKGLI